MSDSPYRPIPCADYDIYEIAIMQKRLLMLKWQSESAESHEKSVRPVKLEIKDGAEYLFVQADNEAEFIIRLDKIHSAIIL